MEIIRIRDHKAQFATIGTFSIVGTKFNIVALEDKDRGLTKAMPLAQIEALKVQNQTAIPTGRYEVTINYSQRFLRDMPLILDVPGYAGVRIHPGNSDVDTDGCILLGLTRVNDDFIGQSKEAFAQFYLLLKQAIDKKEKVFITIQ